jgi:hypothetical protein
MRLIKKNIDTYMWDSFVIIQVGAPKSGLLL